ncbi:Aste57867_16195 [Aphanomyces stellatus]|uniref:Aste57867_16195 protein n=1 Tax=Aphanomyces stellatus TaxID=120398 RepID=A0A485L4X1_9STRA|nr:hypothetical protein As57867_016139 [Aphanomyces stellatus]VFT92973.1 Aste57867_16195 [Aphanomyces stellatus]
MQLLAATFLVAATALAQSSDPPSCTPVSVEHDATYCIDGAICSGDGTVPPAGTACPVQGDIASASCDNVYLPSYSIEYGNCVAPTDAICQVLATSGAWGCVWNTTTPSTTTPAPTTPAPTTPAPTTTVAP